MGECEREFGTDRGAPVEVLVFSLSGFERAAELDSSNAWDRYGYTHAKVVLDKLGGTITRLVAEKGILPPEVAHKLAAAALDAYINSYYRSIKNHLAGLELASQLDAGESISHFLDTLFALYRRVRPYNKYLAWELQTFPLEENRWSAGSLLERIAKIVSSGDLLQQRTLFRSMEKLAREHDLGAVVDGWEADFPLLYGP